MTEVATTPILTATRIRPGIYKLNTDVAKIQIRRDSRDRNWKIWDNTDMTVPGHKRHIGGRATLRAATERASRYVASLEERS